jgi:flagellar motor switch protein FliM
VAENPGHLSQNEIDALLATIGSDEVEEKPEQEEAPAEQRHIKVYDFRRPDVFSKEQMRALRLIHENWARRISVSLTSSLRGSVEVDLADIDQGIYVSLAQQLGVSGVFYVIGLGALPGRFMLHMPTELAMKIVDRIMGGPGVNIETSRDLTELEVDLLSQVVERMATDLRESWSGTILLNPRIDDTALNLMLVPIALPADAIVTVTFEVRVRGLASSMTMGLPYPVLKPIAARLNPYNTWVKSDSIKTEDADRQRRQLQRSVETVTLPVAALLGSTHLSVADLASIQPGDIIRLSTPANALCEVQVNGQTKFYARPGMRRRQVCAQIEGVVEDKTTAIIAEAPAVIQEVEL